MNLSEQLHTYWEKEHLKTINQRIDNINMAINRPFTKPFWSDPLDDFDGEKPILKGELGTIHGVTFVNSDVDLEDMKPIKRTGYTTAKPEDDLSNRFKAIDQEIKTKWGT